MARTVKNSLGAHLVLGLAGLCCLSAGAIAKTQWSDASAAEIDSRLTSLMQENGVVGMALGIALDDKLVFASGYGYCKLGETAPITVQSVFHWASVSKPFVATAVMQLVEEGSIKLGDRLSNLLPYFSMSDDRYRQITVQQLLTHTSGMPDVEDYEWDAPQFDDEALKRWAQQQVDAKLLFEPGTDRLYSNLGFELLGLIVQEVSGLSFEEYMERKIFRPLQMVNSSFVANEIDAALRTTGHLGAPTRRIARHYPYNRRHAPSSTLNSNILDMSRYATALLNNGVLAGSTIIDEDALATMWSVAWTDPDDSSRQSGLGWNVGRRWGGILILSHGGHDDGFRSFLAIAPEEGVAVFLASNDDSAPVGPFMLAAFEVLFPEHVNANGDSN